MISILLWVYLPLNCRQTRLIPGFVSDCSSVGLEGHTLFKNRHVVKTGFLSLNLLPGSYAQHIFKKLAAQRLQCDTLH